MWKVASRLQYCGKYLELEAQAAPEEPIGRYEDNLAVAGGKSHVTLGEKIAAVGQNLGVAGDKSGQTLANLHAQVRVDVVSGLAVGVLWETAGPLIHL